MWTRTSLLLWVLAFWLAVAVRQELFSQEDGTSKPDSAGPEEVAPGEEETAVQHSLQGMWIAISCEQGGKKLSQPAVPCLVFEQDRFTIEEGKRSLEGQYRINSTTDPKQLLMSIPGRGGLTASFGFQAGKLAFCFDPRPNAPAPEKLESVEGRKQILVVLAPALVRRFEGHRGPVGSVAFAPDGKLLASGSGWPKGDRTVRVWNVSRGEEVQRIDITSDMTKPGMHGPQEVAGEVRSLVFSADGRHLLVGGAGGFVHLYEVASGKLVRRFEGYGSTVYGVAISADGRLVLGAGRESRITVWDAKSGDVLRRLVGHKGWIRSLALSPDGRRVLSGSFDGTVRLWDVESGKQLHCFEPGGWVFGLAFSPDGRRAAAAIDAVDADVPVSPLCVWDLQSGEQIHRIDAHRYGTTSVAFSPDGRQILSGGYDRTMRLWDAATGKELRHFPRHGNWVWSVAFSPDGQFALSAGGGLGRAGEMLPGDDFAIRLWNLTLATGK